MVRVVRRGFDKAGAGAELEHKGGRNRRRVQRMGDIQGGDFHKEYS